MALPRWSRTLSERQLCGPTFPTEGTESAAAGAVTGEGLAGVADACTTAGVLLKTVRWGPREQPKVVRSMPVDKNKTAFFILFPHKVFVDGRGTNILKSGVVTAFF